MTTLEFVFLVGVIIVAGYIGLISKRFRESIQDEYSKAIEENTKSPSSCCKKEEVSKTTKWKLEYIELYVQNTNVSPKFLLSQKMHDLVTPHFKGRVYELNTEELRKSYGTSNNRFYFSVDDQQDTIQPLIKAIHETTINEICNGRSKSAKVILDMMSEETPGVLHGEFSDTTRNNLNIRAATHGYKFVVRLYREEN